MTKISNCTKSTNDFVLIEGKIKSAQETERRPKRRSSYRIKLINHPYKKIIFSNYPLYGMKSGLNYDELLKSGNLLRTHVLKKELWTKASVRIYSLEINDESIIELEKRSYPDFKFLLIGGLFVFFGWLGVRGD